MNSKSSITNQTVRSRIVTDVPVEKVVLAGNVRALLDEEEQTALAQSVAQNGILVPLLGHPENELVGLDDGYRRFDVAKRLRLATVPMLLADHAPSPTERSTLQLLANTMRLGLKVTEHGRALHELMQSSGWSAAEVSLKLGGPSPSMISKLLSLLILPREVQDAIDAGRIPMSSAYEIVKIADAVERDQLVRDVLDGKLTRDRLAAQIKAHRTVKGTAPVRKPRRLLRERVVIPLGGGRTVSLSAPQLSVGSAADWLSELADRMRAAASSGRGFDEFVKGLTKKAG